MAKKNTPKNSLLAERKALEKQIEEHKRTLSNIQKILDERKQLENLKSEEKRQEFLLKHPHLAATATKLKTLLGSTHTKLTEAKAKYKKWSKEHPPKKVTL